MANNPFADAIAKAAEQQDCNVAVSGGEYTPIPEGPVRLRFVGYAELGKHETEWQGKKKVNDKARFWFEVTGPKVEPREDGEPHIISFEKNISQGEKSAYYKLFRRMNHTGEHNVFAQMLGESFRGVIHHSEYGEGDQKRTYANLWDADRNWTINAPFYDDPETGERRSLEAPEARTPLKCFLWNMPDKAQWDSLFVDGEWEAKEGKPAKSKNVWQAKIKSAVNWVGSAAQELLLGEVDLGDATRPERTEEAVEASKDAKAAAQADKASGDPLDDLPF